ncbi:MAG: PDZ domain-containing protein, partial [Chloroflexota bacterium]
AIPVANQLVSNGRVLRPYLGIGAGEVDRAIAAQMDLSVREGVLVVRVESGGPADRAGIRKDDVIVALDSQPTPSFLAMQRLLLSQFKVGQRINVTVARGKDQKQFTLTLGEFPR